MNKLIAILLAIFSYSGIQAQSLQLLQLTDSLPAAASYTFNIAANDPLFAYEFIVRNVTTNNISTKVRRTILSTVTGHDISFCYGSTCYTPSTAVSNTVVINAGEELPGVVGTFGIRTDFDNNGFVGTSVVKYTASDANNSNDTSVVYITYVVSAVGITNYNKQSINTSISPNPASGVVKINYNLAGKQDAAIKIYNSLGALVRTVRVKPTESYVSLDVSDLEEGMYFYTLSSTGISPATRRFIIAR